MSAKAYNIMVVLPVGERERQDVIGAVADILSDLPDESFEVFDALVVATDDEAINEQVKVGMMEMTG